MIVRNVLRQAVATVLAWSLVLGAPISYAADLNGEVTNMFNSLGAIGNYTAPGAFKGQTFNTYTGGNLYLRSPNKTYQLAAIQFPSAKGGCGGIDLFGGSFSHISAAEFRNMLRNITAALPGIAFQLALEAVSPLLGGLTKWAKGLETWINNARINSCETATALVASAADAVGYDSQRACSKLALQMGLETDIDAAMRRCANDSPSILASARGSADPNIRAQAPFVGNFTWKALKNIDTLDDPAREMVMSVVGAVIFYAQESNRDPEYVGPSITTVAQLLYGQSDATGGNVNVQLLRCNNYTDCDVVSRTNANVHEPLNPSLSSLAAQAAVVNQIPQAYVRGQIATAASTAADLIRQNAMINAINDAGEMGCQKINDPSCMMLATGRASAVASQNAAWINGAKIAEQALPVVRNVAEAMCYAVFPVIVLLLFLSTGRTTLLILTGYVAALISIQLWPPLFAILNYMASIYSQLDQAAAAEVGGGVKALALQSASPIYANAVSAQAVVSYLIIGIPMLAYSLASRLVNFGSAMVGGLQGLQSTSVTGSPAAGAALGNSNLGNVTMDQRVVSPSNSSPWVSRDQDLDGNWTTTTGNGAQAISFLRNEGATSRIVSSRVSQSNVTEASRAAEAARSDIVSASNDLSSTLVDTVSRASGRFQSSSGTIGRSISSSEELGQSADRIRTISDGIAKATGLSAQQVQQIGFQLSGGVGTPGVSPIKGSATGTASKNYSSSLNEAEQKVANELTTDQLREFRSFRDRASRDEAFVRSLGADMRDGQELASRLSRATSRVESAQSTYAERQAVAERLSTAYERGETLSVDLAQLPANSDFMRRYQRLATEYGSDSLALQAAMASELATRALPPTRDPSTFSALPASFSDVSVLRQEALADPLFSRSRVDAAEVSNDRSVTPSINSRTLHAPDVPAALRGMRGDVTARNLAAGAAPSAAATFDARNEITRNPDGTVSTKRSQVLGNARQLRDDVSNLADNVGELITGAPDRAAAIAAEARARNAESQRARDIDATPEVPTMRPSDGKRRKP